MLTGRRFVEECGGGLWIKVDGMKPLPGTLCPRNTPRVPSTPIFPFHPCTPAIPAKRHQQLDALDDHSGTVNFLCVTFCL